MKARWPFLIALLATIILPMILYAMEDLSKNISAIADEAYIHEHPSPESSFLEPPPPNPEWEIRERKLKYFLFGVVILSPIAGIIIGGGTFLLVHRLSLPTKKKT